ncbi:MAG: oligosaccharide flippase family protein [Bacteroidales bacterium]|nr:oligosaccharide flippase family protein [Bacteroidales bacterium]
MTLVQNFSYLSALQIFNMMVPLITLPYLLKVLGRETYGLVIFAQAIVSYFQILIDFGFNLSSTRNISIHRNDKDKISEIVSSTLLLKGLLFICSVLILTMGISLFPKINENRTLFLLMMHLGLYEWIFPIWYFQGLEKMKYITLINLVSRVIFLSLVFILIKHENDYLKVPIINGLGALIAGIVALFIVFKRDRVKFVFPKRTVVKHYFFDSLPLFFANIAGKIKILTNKAVLGSFVGMESVALYDIADKIKAVFLAFLQIIGQVLFPNVSQTRNRNLTRRGVRFILFVGLGFYLFSGVLLAIVIPVYFSEYMEIIKLFWILGLLIIIQPVSYLIGTGVLLVNDLKHQYTRNLYISMAVYLVLIGICFILGIISIYTTAYCLVLSAITGLTGNVIVCNRNRILNWVI